MEVAKSADLLHERVVAGDPTAKEEAATLLLAAVSRLLLRKCRHAPSDFVLTAVEDAILEYLARPDRFDGRRGVRVEQFVSCITTRDLSNLQRAERRRHAREQTYAEGISFVLMRVNLTGQTSHVRCGVNSSLQHLIRSVWRYYSG